MKRILDGEYPRCFHCERVLCKQCGFREAEKIGKSRKTGEQLYRSVCQTCNKNRWGFEDTRTSRDKSPWKTLSMKIRQEVGKCERCDFTPEHLGQLDVDHIDGNPDNNDRINLMVLCSNCHRLKTILAKDFVNTRARRKLEAWK